MESKRGQVESHVDVLIIGGGVIGVCSAYYLASKGLQVVLIEKDEIASGCSYGNGGLIVPSHAVPLASPGALGDGLRWLFDAESPFYIKPRLDTDLFKWLVRFTAASRKSVMLRSLPILRDLLMAGRTLYEELASTSAFDFGYKANGSLWVCLSEAGLEEESKEVRQLEQFNVPVQVMERDEVRALEPALSPQVIGGIYYPLDGHIDPARFVVGLAEKARGLGVQVWTKTEAMRFETSNGRITAVHTTRGILHPAQVVLAAGSWSPALARSLRLRIPIEPAKGYSITLENPALPPKLPLLLGEASVVVNPLSDSLRLAGTLELAGMDFSYNSRRLDAIQRSSRAYLVGLDTTRVVEIWRGLRPCTPDGLPIISRSRAFNNLILAAGHAMLGMSLGPVTGKLVSQLVANDRPDLDLTPLRLERF